jgi:hypothetical protein
MVRKKKKGVVKASKEDTNGPKALNIVDVITLHDVADVSIKVDNGILEIHLQKWYDSLASCSTVYEQLNMLHLIRSQLKKLFQDKEQFYNQLESLILFIPSLWRLCFHLYVSSEMEPLRKSCYLILMEIVIIEQLSQDVSHPFLKELESALLQTCIEEGCAFFDKMFAVPMTSPEVVVQVFDLLLLVASFPYIAKSLIIQAKSSENKYIVRFFEFTSKQLAFVSEPIAHYLYLTQEQNTSAPTNTVLIASERCGHLLKCAIAFLNMREFLYDHVKDLEWETALGKFGLEMLEHCALILKTTVVHKDLLTQTGLAYCLLLRLLFQPYQKNEEDSSYYRYLTVQFLMENIYPDLKILTDTSIFNQLPCDLLHIMQTLMRSLNEMSKLAVYRGAMNSLWDKELIVCLPGIGVDVPVLDHVFSTVQSVCMEDSLNTRLYAFQVLEAYLRRAVSIVQNGNLSINKEVLSNSTLTSLISHILLNWEHPSKKVNQFMAPMFTNVVSLLVLMNKFDNWKDRLMKKLVLLPQYSRGKYGALSILLKHHSAKQLLQENTGLLQSILIAVGNKDVSAAAASLFTQILNDLNASVNEKESKWREMWILDVVQVLTSEENASLRSRVAMYALPLLLKKDPDCVHSLVNLLQLKQVASKTDASKDVCLWALIEVLKLARKSIAPEKIISISSEAIEQGLYHTKAETRAAAFEAVCASLKSTTMSTEQEFKLIKIYLVVCSKSVVASSRMNTIIGLKSVLFRVKETIRIQQAKVDKNGQDAHGSVQATLKLAIDFKNWVELFIVSCVYPGAIPQRNIIGLEVMMLYLQLFGFPNKAENSLLNSRHMVTILLNMLISAWDVIRSLSHSILEMYPKELPGFTEAKDLRELMNWSLVLCCSPRQRESDAGALFMRVLYERSEFIQRLGLSFSKVSIGALKYTCPRASFISQLVFLLSSRLEALSNLEILMKGDSPLVHGLLLSLRYVIENTDFVAINPKSEWQQVTNEMLRCIWQSMKLSLCVVGDATSGIGDQKLCENYAVKGEVNVNKSTTANIPLRVDCRGHLILDDQDQKLMDGPEEEASDDVGGQRAVVGSWLAARECGAVLHTLLRRVPWSTSADDKESLIKQQDVQRAGETLLNSLFELKHKGAVAMAYQSFEGICRTLLIHSEENPLLGALPSKWANQLLERLEKSEQHFILRRSSGFAYSFVAILRSEPRNAAAIILPKVMGNLLRIASLNTDALTAADMNNSVSQSHTLWRSRVHALNILKLICQDAVLADDVATYIPRMLEIAVFGFESRSWAVRNSSMMLFAATTQRAIGDKRIADGASKERMADTEVFSRFQTLSSFLYDHIKKSLVLFESTRMPPPGLYPVLMFLSRLKPGDPESSKLELFIPLIIECADQTHIAIRQVAARVLSTFVQKHRILSVLRELKALLPREFLNSERDVSPSKRYSSNKVHGLLLQMLYLFEKVKRLKKVDKDSEQAIFSFMGKEFLPEYLWIASEKVQCGPIRAVYMQIAQAFFDISESSSHVSPFFMNEFRMKCLYELKICADASIQEETLKISRHSPGAYAYNRVLVRLLFALMELDQVPIEDMIQLLSAMLGAKILEIRKSTVKKLSNAMEKSSKFKFQNLSNSIMKSLTQALLTQLLIEDHPKVKARQLYLVLDLCKGDEKILSGLDFFTSAVSKHLQHIVSDSHDAGVIAPALELLALFTRAAPSDEAVRVIKEQVLLRSSERQPLRSRLAACTSLSVSHLLLRNDDIAFECWRSALVLLQDDDANVRAAIRHTVHEAMKQTVLNGHDMGRMTETKLYPLAVNFFLDRFIGVSTYTNEQIFTMVTSALDAPLLVAGYQQDWGDLCSNIFEAESTNYFIEKDLTTQLYIHGLLTKESKNPLSEKLQKFVLEKVAECLQLLKQDDMKKKWLGGISYYSTIFGTLFNLLAAGVAVIGSLEQNQLMFTFKEVVSIVRSLAVEVKKQMSNVHPLLLKALEVLSIDNQSQSKSCHETTKQLLFMTPYWRDLE